MALTALIVPILVAVHRLPKVQKVQRVDMGSMPCQLQGKHILDPSITE